MVQPGDIIADKYRIERLLGQGGMGSVYETVNVVLQKRVALKVMGEAFTAQADAVQRFFREAMSASRVRHPAIVEIYDAGSHQGAPWMAMELLEGQSLGQRIERGGPLRAGELRAIFLPVLSALDVVHQQGIVHRDLKPDNLFLEQLGDGGMQPKLLDFGIAKSRDGLDKLTATGAVMGTAHYLAPEQARDSSAVDPRTDLYAIGVVLYEALSGRMPHAANTLPELITKLISEEPTPLLGVAPHVPAPIANLVHWCLARDPGDRPQRAADLAYHLTQALEGIPDEPVRLVGDPGPSEGRSTGPAVGFASTAAAALGGAGGAVGAPYAASPTPAPIAGASGGWPGTAGGPHPTQPLPPSHGAPWSGGAAPLGYAAAPARGSGSGMNRIVIAFLVVAVLGGVCVFAAPIALSVIGFAVAGAAGGGGGFPGREWPRWWEEWHLPVLVDVNGDGTNDVVGWSRRIIATDLHELLCAFDGTDGRELWCADVGEQDDLNDTRTVFLAEDVVYLDHRGRVYAFRLSNGERHEHDASVRGTPEEVCALGDDRRLAVRTADRLWSIVDVRTGAVSAPADTQPPGCSPARTTTRPATLGMRTASESWTEVRRDRPRLPDVITVRSAFASAADADEMLLVGLAVVPGRAPGKLAMRRQGEIVWEAVVPVDPLTAQAHPPEAMAMTEDVAFASYEMTARGDAPRHVTAFRLADGQRLWDVPLPTAHGGRVGSLVTDGALVLLSVGEILLAIDARTGNVRFQLGERASSD